MIPGIGYVVMLPHTHGLVTGASARDQCMAGGIVERLSIKTPEDFISLMGHTLGYWPKESLVCLTLDGRRIGSTLRVGLPTEGADTARYVHDVVKCITNDREATGVVFGIFTPAPWEPLDDRPYDDVIGILAGELSQHSIKVRDGWIIGETSFTNYFQIVPDPLARSPLETIKTSELNAELVFRGSSIEPGPGFRIPILARRDLRPLDMVRMRLT